MKVLWVFLHSLSIFALMVLGLAAIQGGDVGWAIAAATLGVFMAAVAFDEARRQR